MQDFIINFVLISYLKNSLAVIVREFFVIFVPMRIFVVAITVDYEGATALAAFKNKDEALESLHKNIEAQFEFGYEIVEEGGDDTHYYFKYYRLDADDEDSPTLVFSVTETELV